MVGIGKVGRGFARPTAWTETVGLEDSAAPYKDDGPLHDLT